MFVYGIRCNINDLAYLGEDLSADYYNDYGILVFPDYTHPACMNAFGNLNSDFWNATKRIMEEPHKVHQIFLEHPYLTDEQGDAIAMLQGLHSNSDPSWYYIPAVVSRLPDMSHITITSE